MSQDFLQEIMDSLFSSTEEYEGTPDNKESIESKIDAEMEFVKRFGSSYEYRRNQTVFIMKTRESMRECIREMLEEQC